MNRILPAASHSLLFIILLYLLTGCAGFGPTLEKPKISLTDIQILEIKPLETAFLIQLRVMNPNNTPLDIEGLSCNIELDEQQFATGVQGGQQSIPPYGYAIVPVEVFASVLDMFNSAYKIVQGAQQPGATHEPVKYRLTGKVRVSYNGLAHTLPFESEGELNLK